MDPGAEEPLVLAGLGRSLGHGLVEVDDDMTNDLQKLLDEKCCGTHYDDFIITEERKGEETVSPIPTRWQILKQILKHNWTFLVILAFMMGMAVATAILMWGGK